MSLEINLDLTQIQRMLQAYNSALVAFCEEFRHSRPDEVDTALSVLDRVASEHGLGEDTFTMAKRALLGEELDT